LNFITFTFPLSIKGKQVKERGEKNYFGNCAVFERLILIKTIVFDYNYIYKISFGLILMMKYGVLIVLGLIFVSLGSALTINDSLETNVIIKEYGNSLAFYLNVTDLEEGDYNVYTLSDVYISPNTIYSFEDGDSFEEDFVIDPMTRLLRSDGDYVIKYYLNHRGVEKHEKRFGIKVLSLADALAVDVEAVDLGAGMVEVVIDNLYDVEVDNLTARFSSILFDVERTFDLVPGEGVKINIPISSEELRKVKTGKYLMEVEIETPEGNIYLESDIYLNEERGIKTLDDSKGIIFRTSKIEKWNIGNTIEDVRIEIKRNILTRFFTSFNEDPLTTVRDGFIIKYVWEARLNPANNYKIEVTTNFLYPLLITVVLCFIVIGLRRFFKMKLVVEKSVTPVKTKNGEFALRVRLLVRAKKSLEEVALIDRIPKTVKIYKKFGLSMPDEIDAATRRLKWNIGELKSGEERMFSYVVYSRVGFVGKFMLPSALGLFKFDSDTHQIESNSVFFLAEQTDRED
jgi:hypothetical protein